MHIQISRCTYIYIYIDKTGVPGRAVFPCQSVLLIAVMQTITPTDLPGHEDAKG